MIGLSTLNSTRVFVGRFRSGGRVLVSHVANSPAHILASSALATFIQITSPIHLEPSSDDSTAAQAIFSLASSYRLRQLLTSLIN